jgi:hypothetical protein
VGHNHHGNTKYRHQQCFFTKLRHPYEVTCKQNYLKSTNIFFDCNTQHLLCHVGVSIFFNIIGIVNKSNNLQVVIGSNFKMNYVYLLYDSKKYVKNIFRLIRSNLDYTFKIEENDNHLLKKNSNFYLQITT